MNKNNATIYTCRTALQKKVHIIFRTILSTIVITIALLFTHELIYPTYTFHFRASIDSLANTISRPYVTEYGTGFDIATAGDFSKARVTITLSDHAEMLPNDTSLTARHSYRAFFAPLSENKYTDHITQRYAYNNDHYIVDDDLIYSLISENAAASYLFGTLTDISALDNPPLPYAHNETVRGFAPATLIASREGIYVTADTKKHPIQDEITFSALGYNYDNVIAATSQERAVHKKARMITTESTHPFGTLFYTNDANRTYIYDDNVLYKIDSSAEAQRHAITVQEKSRATFDSCVLKRSFLARQTYTCTLQLDKIASFSGNTYQFIINDIPGIDIERAKIALSTHSTSTSLSHRIGELKQSLRNLYTK